MPDDWEGHPLRKDAGLGGVDVPFKGAHIPPPDRAELLIDRAVLRTGLLRLVAADATCPAVREDTMVINLGPQHPSTHGVLRAGPGARRRERRSRADPVIGYLHTGIEKNTEVRTWQQGVAFVTRMDYLSPFFNEIAYCLAVERLLGIEAPAAGPGASG